MTKDECNTYAVFYMIRELNLYLFRYDDIGEPLDKDKMTEKRLTPFKQFASLVELFPENAKGKWVVFKDGMPFTYIDMENPTEIRLMKALIFDKNPDTYGRDPATVAEEIKTTTAEQTTAPKVESKSEEKILQYGTNPGAQYWDL